MPRLFITVALFVVVSVGVALPAAAQDPLATAKDLYAAASYEEALTLLAKVEAGDPAVRLEAAKYQVFCLIALDRTADAEKIAEQILDAHPLFVPNNDEASPRVVQLFERVRTRATPKLARSIYAEGKAALDKKDRATAVQRFELLLQVIDRGGANDSTLLAELKLLASGYLDLARAAQAPAPAPSASAPDLATNGNGAKPKAAAAGADNAAPASNGGADFVAAVPTSEVFPAYDPKFLGKGGEFKGVIRVRISAAGRVEGAEIIEPIHPNYDARLLQAALRWRYQPAKRGGAPVASDRFVAVHLKP